MALHADCSWISWGVRITIDVSGEPAGMALQIGDGPPDWQSIDPELAGYALRAAATGAVFGDSIVSWET